MQTQTHSPTFSLERPSRVSTGNRTSPDPAETYSVFFHVSSPGKAELAISGKANDRAVPVQATVSPNVWQTQLKADKVAVHHLGEIAFDQPGYVRVDLRLPQPGAAELTELIVSSDDETLVIDFVQNNDGNMFYWGRRGPSVHLKYDVPRELAITHAYSEITVPVGQDAIGSYFMANGFGEGYFGIQVNSPSERRVLFSVWSPFRTDNPNDIPESDRIATLAKGDDVLAQDFGNEGSGGQSFLVYPWEAGTTYRFLTEVQPDGDGNTRYSSWFGDKTKDEWRLIASFRRPKTDKHLTGFHSFLENFSPHHGHQQRSAYYGSQWVRDTSDQWHEVTCATLTADATARGRHRLDYAGGADADLFYMKNCGFFADTSPLDETFDRQAKPNQPPRINFETLTP